MPDVSLADARSAADTATVRLTELPVQGLLEITCPDGVEFTTELAELSPLSGRQSMTANSAATGRTIRQAPNRWLFCSGAAPEAELEPTWSTRLRPLGGSAVEVSHGWRRFEIGGPRARDLLAKAMEIDLRRTHFGAGDSRQTLFVRVPAILHAVADERFELLIATSFADWAKRWLCDAAREFGFAWNFEETQR